VSILTNEDSFLINGSQEFFVRFLILMPRKDNISYTFFMVNFNERYKKVKLIEKHLDVALCFENSKGIIDISLERSGGEFAVVKRTGTDFIRFNQNTAHRTFLCWSGMTDTEHNGPYERRIRVKME